MPSDRYRQLRKQVTQLRRILLPRDLKADLLELTPRLSVRALSFRMLSHAEMEHYLEDRVVEIAEAADAAWKSRGHVSRTTLSLLAFSGLTLEQLPESFRAPKNKKQSEWGKRIKPDSRLSSAISLFHSGVRMRNHGIKEENVVRLLVPVGYRADDIDLLLVDEMNNFGTLRGEAAHISAVGHVRKGINPKDEYNRVERILLGLLAIDNSLDALLEAAA